MHQISVETYHEMQDCGHISRITRKTLEFIRSHPDQTAMEIDALFKHDKKRPQAPPSITHLKELGLIKETGKRECTVTGHVAATFVAVEGKAMPIPPWPKKVDWERSKHEAVQALWFLEALGYPLPKGFEVLRTKFFFEYPEISYGSVETDFSMRQARLELVDLLVDFMKQSGDTPLTLEARFPHLHKLGRAIRDQVPADA